MPLPFLLAGLGMLAGAVGIGSHVSAKKTNDRAQEISKEAQNIYYNAKHSLELAQNKTEKSLLKLGYTKKNILDTSMKQFINSYDKIKHIQVIQSAELSEISDFTINYEDTIQIQEMTNIYSSVVKNTVSGAASGAIIALAASGSLTVVTGGLASAGSAVIAGEIGAAAGIAGSALSFGAAMTPLAAIAAPVLLFTGISASIKAEENLEKANTMYSQANAASEKMKVSETLCEAITEKAEMFYNLLINLNEMFTECSNIFAGIVKKKEGRIFKRMLTSTSFSKNDLKLIAVTRALAGAVKALIDTPILSDNGNISSESNKVYNHTSKTLPDFCEAVKNVRQVDYGTKPIKIKSIKTSHYLPSDSKPKKNSSNTNTLALLSGFTVATIVSCFMVIIISTYSHFKFLYLADTIAVWIILFTSFIMLIGKYSDKDVNFRCYIASRIGLIVLYVQYCKSMQSSDHYFISSILLMLSMGFLWRFFYSKEIKWKSALYFSELFFNIALFPILFLTSLFFTGFLLFSDGFSLFATTLILGLFMYFRRE